MREHRALRERLCAEICAARPGLGQAAVIDHARRVLDRTLVVAVAESRGWIPRGSLTAAAARGAGDDPGARWRAVHDVFDGIQRITMVPGVIHGGDPEIGRLEISGALCEDLARISRFDFQKDISIEILGNVLEQSRRDIESSKRHDEGVYYTPSHLARGIVERTLGRALAARREAALARPGAAIDGWRAYRADLARVRVLDPASGAGAFLVAAYEVIARERAEVERAIAELGGDDGAPLDVERAVLEENLFGVDRDPAAVEMAKISLWLKTGRRGYLDSNVTLGDSIVSPDKACPSGGFDVVIGNPPYVRQELLTGIKDHLSRSYAVYHGMADLYVYFFERGLSLLAPGGRLGFVVSNKWLRAAYAAPLRRLLARGAAIESLIDFGHAPVFAGADAFPCIITLRKLAAGEAAPDDHEVEVSVSPGAATAPHAVPQRRLGEDPWILLPDAAEALVKKMNARGAPLREAAGAGPRYGLKTGHNEAFLIDGEARDQIVRESPEAEGLLAKYLRGQDIGRWAPMWRGLWIILLKSSGDHPWPWATMAEPEAEACFAARFPALFARMKPREDALRRRRDRGRFWWELRPCAYYDAFTGPKIVYQEIQFRPAYALEHGGLFLNNKAFLLGSGDPWILAALNSPLMWWYNFRHLGRMKDDALSPAGVKMERIPIAPPDGEGREAAEEIVPRLAVLAREDQETRSSLTAALQARFGIDRPREKVLAFDRISREAFVAEIARRLPRGAGKLGRGDVEILRGIHDEHAVPIQDRRRRAIEMEQRLSDLVNRAYGLTACEIDLIRQSAPPRMPLEE